MEFGDRLIQVRKEHGYTREALAQSLGISKYTLRNYELEATEPGHSFLIQISDIFDVSIDYLLGITNEKERTAQHKLKTSEYAHIEKYRTLDSYGKNAIDSLLNIEYERCSSLCPHLTEEEARKITQAAAKKLHLNEKTGG